MLVQARGEIDAQAVIAEARARQRRRWRRRGVVAAAVVVALGAAAGGYEAAGSSPGPRSAPFATAASQTWHSAGPALWSDGFPSNYLGLGPSTLITCAGGVHASCYVVIQANGIAPDGKPTVAGEPGGLSPWRSTAYRTTDNGRTWSTLPLPPATWLSTRIACGSATSCVAGAILNAGEAPGAAGSSVAVLTSRDGGQSWQHHPLPSWVGLVTDVACPTARHCVALAWGNNGRPIIDGLQPHDGADRFYPTRVLTSDDGGLTWTESATLPGRSGSHYLYLSSVSCTGSDCVFIGDAADIVADQADGSYVPSGVEGVVLASTDGGSTLHLSYRSSVWPTALACAGHSDCLAVLTDNAGHPTMLAGGATRPWHTLPTANLPGSWTSSLACPAAGHCLATGAVSQVAVTTDGGAHWTSSPLPPAPRGYDAQYSGPAACSTSGTCLLLDNLEASGSAPRSGARVLTNSP